jgi:hypothetical protein
VISTFLAGNGSICGIFGQVVPYDAAKKAARLGKAKQAHDELIAAAYRAQADALEIEAQAKRASPMNTTRRKSVVTSPLAASP